jgi:transcriptional regulator with XRE-family HTH domain
MKKEKNINEITKRIDKELKLQHISAYQMCKKIGMHEGTFSNTRRNSESWKGAIHINLISEYLHKSERYFITGSANDYDENKTINQLKKELGDLREEYEESQTKLSILTGTLSELLSTKKADKETIFKSLLSKLSKKQL